MPQIDPRAYHKSKSVRYAAAQKKSISKEQLDLHAKDESEFVRSAAAKNAHATQEQLSHLSKDPHENVRSEVAYHKNTPKHILDKLVTDPHPHVRAAIAQRKDGYGLHHLHKDDSSTVRDHVARSPHASEEQLHHLSKDEDQHVLASVAQNPNSTHSHLSNVLNSKHNWVKSYIPKHPNATDHHLKHLAKHEDTYLQHLAKKEIAKRKPKMTKEEFDALVENIDQLDELSKATLGSYLKKAKASHKDANSKERRALRDFNVALKDGEKSNIERREQELVRHGSLAQKRADGIFDAKKRLTKESTEMYTDLIQAIEESNAKDIAAIFEKAMAEKLQGIFDDSKAAIVESVFEDADQLDELSKTTLGSYVKKANRSAIDAAHALGDKKAKADEIDRFTNRLDGVGGSNYREKMKDDAGVNFSHQNKDHEKMSKRHRGITNAVKRLTKEDLESMTEEEMDSLIENLDQLDEVSGKLLGSYIQKARADRQKKYDNENELNQHPKVKKILDKRRELYNRREYTKSGDSIHRKTIDKLRAKEPEVKKKLDPNYPKSGIQGANKRGRGIEAAIKKLTQGKLTN